ncbi:MAG: homocysteine S-methyltransferase family protein [Treponema sp.]|nr:homocysteine S-methyltransferase family protein [Treponema sp.]
MSGAREIFKKAYSDFVFIDGGCGSILQAQGLQPGELPETWNILHPEIIQKMHRDYLLAGANILTSNTFGANINKFQPGDIKFSLDAVIGAAIKNAREAIAAVENDPSTPESVRNQPHFVALDIGPLGKLLKPLGDLDFEDAVKIFSYTVKIGAKHGADLVLIETMNDLYEAKAALLAAKENCDLPVLITTAYDESEKLLTGADPMTVVATMEGLGADAVGVNCSLGPDQMLGIVQELCRYASIPVVVSPNAGLPRSEGGKTVYDVEPADFAESMKKIAGLGATMLGGCCGTTPAHIKAMSDAVRAEVTPAQVQPKNDTIITSYTHSVIFDRKPVLIGERINPTGKKKFKEALRAHDMDYILGEALTQKDKKADVLDVNVGLPEIDEVQMMEDVVKEIQAVIDLPLQIDTTNPEAMERALRLYNGKPMINSVNGKEEVMQQIFPLAKKYGGLLVALTIDESGIPETAEGRVAIARKIYARASDYGIAAKNIIIDPLAMSISSDPKSAIATLDALKAIRDQLGGKTSLGVSNISFGLPTRDFVNAAFFTLAMHNGLSAAIMNPNSLEMMKSYYTFCALLAIDENCANYIDFATNMPALQSPVALSAQTSSSPVEKTPADSSQSELIDAIRRGLKERAAVLTAEMLKSKAALEIIDGELIPALDIVGKGFEKKTVFLPQLLMAAEAASAAFAVIKEQIAAAGGASEKKGKIVLATVKGDIHDIGKNIVKVLLENYGYDVIDLGKDVDPELILETVQRENIRLVGLSALMTTTVPAMEATIKLLRGAGSPAKVVVGGAVMTQNYADMIGADKYCHDAMETVRYAEEIFS